MTKTDSVAVLREACEGLLAFIREKYPDDFKEGGRGYICPHHIAIAQALAALSAQGAEPVAWIDSHKLARLRDGWSGVVYGKAASEYAGQLSVPPELVPLYLHPAPPCSDAVTETHELPELPQCWTGSPVTVTWAEDGERTTREVYTAEQMRQYALAALAARTGKGE